MIEISIIPEEDMEKKSEKKYKTSPTAESVFNIETGKNYKVDPRKVTAYDLPIVALPSKMEKKQAYRDAIIIDIGRKLKKVKENIKNCNTSVMTDLCKISNILDIQSQYIYTDPSFDLLNRDIKKTQQEFIDNCKLSTKTIKK